MAGGEGGIAGIGSSPLEGEDTQALQLVCLAGVGEGGGRNVPIYPSPSYASSCRSKLRYPLPQGERRSLA